MPRLLANITLQVENEDLIEVAHKTLIIGDLNRWRAAGRNTDAFKHFEFTDISDLTMAVLARFDPEIILSPLVGDSFDVFEVSQRLQEIGFRGRYRAICSNIPNIDVIRDDVSQVAPDLDFDLLQLASKTSDDL